MKIVQLDIQGFRSLKNVSWRPGDLNVVIGPNGSGKSNLLRMLELISASAQSKLSRYVQSAGGMGAIVWDGQVDSIKFQLTTGNETTFPALVYEATATRTGLRSSFRIEQEALQNQSSGFVYMKRTGTQAEVNDGENPMMLTAENISEEETLLPVAWGPFFKNSAILAFRKRIENWSVYQDLRVDQTAPIRQAPVSRLEERVTPGGQNLINVLHTLYTNNRTFKQDINDAMHAAFGEDFDELIFPPAADQRVQMRVRWKTLQRDQSTADLSDGTLRFLFLMTVLASPNPPPLIAIDEPETGLHPSMLPIIAEFAVEAATRTQVIFTTHSSQFLDAFRGTKPTTTVAKWENGETVLKTVSDEALAYWLEEYSLGSLFRSGELEDME